MFRAIKQLLASARGSVSSWARGGERSWEDSGQPTASQCAQAVQAAQSSQPAQQPQAAQATQHPQTAQATQVEAGRRRRLWVHKKLSLRRMIVLTVLAVVCV
mgnify:CR=1 FL=1